MNAYVFSPDADYRRMLHLELRPLFDNVFNLSPASLPEDDAVAVVDADSLNEAELNRLLQSGCRLCLLSKGGFSDNIKQNAFCLTRPFLMDELIAFLKNAAASQESVSKQPQATNAPTPLQQTLVYDGKSDCFRLGEEALALSDKEKKLLSLLYQNRGRAVSVDAIFNAIGDRSDPNGNSVTVYISFLRKKLQKDDTSPRLIRTVRGVGYMLI